MTKKVFLFVPISLIIMGALLVAAFFAASPGADRTAFAADFPSGQTGDGTAENPYIISDYSDLEKVAELVNGGTGNYGSAYYSVNVDTIEAPSSPRKWTPIGTQESPFSGVFLGNGVIISGLCVEMNAGSDYGGFFGYIGEKGEVSGVGLYKASVGSVGSFNCFGGIAGYNAGRISECFVDGTVSGLDRVGGIAGENAGTGEIENCFSSADIRPASGSVPLSNAGGIAGSNAGSIRYSYTISAVEAAPDSDSVGGAAGANDGSFTKAYALSITAGGLKAVGEGSAAGVNLLTGYNLQTYALSSMFSDATAARWRRVENYSTGDGASFSGPVQAVFREKASDVTEFDGILFDVFSYRYFSVADVARYDDWGTTAENPYLIGSAEELKDLALLVSARNVEMTGLSAQSYRGKYFALSEDIEIENADSVLPVGSGSTPFSGNFSGRGHKIEGFKINSTDEYTGLFGYLSYASVSDLYIENASVTGTGAAGIAAGRAVSSTLKNIVITASLLTASSNSGAIVAVSDNSGGTQGAIESVYVEATLAARNSSSGTPYADVGVINGSAPSSDGNIWYAGKTVALSRLQATSTVVMREPGADAVLSVDGSEGSYRFTLTAKPNAGTSVEYRDADETIIAADNANEISLDSLRDSGSQYGTKVFYLRFVRTVSIDVEPRNGGTKVISARFLIKGERVTEASLYEGQSATIVIEDLRTEANNNIYYIYDIETEGSDIGLKLTNQTGAATMPTVVGEFTMDDSLDAITVVQSYVSTGTDYINFLTNEYDGEKVKYDNTKLIISYSGGSAETRVEFSSGSAPTDVGEYLVTTDFYGKGGIFENILLGSIRSTLVVNPREITYDPAKDIEVNPERTPTVAWGDSGIITLEIPVEGNKGIGEGQFIEGDVLGISATVTFDAAALLVPGDDKSVSYALSLVGEDAKNYKLTAESVQNVGLGKVEERKIIITFESTSKVYDGQPFEINSFKVTNALESAGAIEHSHLSVEIVPEGTVIEAGDVGKYKVTVQWADATPEVGNGLSFKDVYDIYIEDGKYSLKYVPGSEGIICSVLPKKLDVEYSLTNGETSYAEGDETVYNGTEFIPSAASFTAASGGSTDSLENYIYWVNGSTEEASGNPCNAGNYILKIDAAALAEKDNVYRNYIFEEYAFEIKKAVPTAKVNSEKKYYYSPENVTVTFADAVVIEYPGAEALNVEYVYDGKPAESHSFTAADEYEITVKITGDVNRESAEVKLSITVNKRPVTLSVAEIEAEYGDPIEYLDNIIVTDGLDDNMEIAFSSLGITVTAKNSSGQDIPDVGTYDILLSTENVNSSNYDVTLTTENKGALRVIQKKLYISWEEGLFSEYGQEISVPYTASYEDGTVPESPPLVGELQIGKWETDSNNTDEEIFVPASVNKYGRYGADTYDIGWTEEFEEKNKNYLIIKNGTYAYRIKKAVFGIYVQSNQKNFGEDDPEVTWGLINVFDDEEANNVKNAYQVSVTRESGENAYISEDGAISSPAVYAYSVTVTLNGKEPDNYEYKLSLNELGSLSILRIAPVVEVSENAVEPNTVLDGSVPVNAVAYDLNGSAMAGIFSWATEEGFAPDFIGSASVTVKAKFTPDYGVPENGNYSETEFDVILTVIPAEVAITWGVIRYVYSGETTPEMHYTAVAAGESVTLLLTYSGDRINVGTYTVTASIRDPRFILPANSSVEVEIVPATVTVSFSSPSYEIIAGEQLTPEVVYSGFVGGETAEVLTREAEFTMYSEPGNYKLSLSGAEADNYEFEYVDSDLIIYRAELEDEEAGAKFEGAFPEEVGLTITVADDLNAGNALNEFNLIKGAYKSLSGKVLNTVYSLNYSGLDGYVNNGELTVTMPAFSAESADSVKYLYITNSGEIVVIDDVGYNEDGTVTFMLEDAAYILVSVDDESLFGSMTMYVVIGGVVLAVILLIAVVTAVKRRRKRRIIKFDD